MNKLCKFCNHPLEMVQKYYVCRNHNCLVCFYIGEYSEYAVGNTYNIKMMWLSKDGLEIELNIYSKRTSFFKYKKCQEDVLSVDYYKGFCFNSFCYHAQFRCSQPILVSNKLYPITPDNVDYYINKFNILKTFS